MYQKPPGNVKKSTGGPQRPPVRTAADIMQHALASAARDQRQYMKAVTCPLVTPFDMRVLCNMHQRLAYDHNLDPLHATLSVIRLMGFGLVDREQVLECWP